MPKLARHAELLKSALNPARLPVMARKLQYRFFDKKSGISDADYKQWLAANAIKVDDWCAAKDPALWAETQKFLAELFTRWEELKKTLPDGLGGNACVRLLFFLTRLHKPQTIVETGVAMGFSSQGFLQALQRNGGAGHLYSSDFPYFRLPNAEKYIGCMVEDALKPNWSLYINGDDVNLPKIMAELERNGTRIDLFHYDSDKSYAGRERGYATASKYFSNNVVIVFDDIQDNPHFHDFVMKNKPAKWRVLANRDGGYVGLVNID
jgi:predicted O-methyltransferase YrrM